MGELVRDVGVLGPRVSAEDADGFVGVRAYGDGRTGVLEGEAGVESTLRFDGAPAEAAVARVCLDGPIVFRHEQIKRAIRLFVRVSATPSAASADRRESGTSETTTRFDEARNEVGGRKRQVISRCRPSRRTEASKLMRS